MICRKQPPFPIPSPIKNIWEVILAPDVWERIRKAKKLSRTTYSWVVRYCLFQLLSDENIKENLENNEPSTISRKKGHRMQLCLYGDDEESLRILAVKEKINISKLIRIAIVIFIEKFEKQLQNEKSITRLLMVKKYISRINNVIFDSIWKNRIIMIEKIIYGYHSIYLVE